MKLAREFGADAVLDAGKEEPVDAIREITGGAGVDYTFNHRIRVTGEAFDFGKSRDPNPHLRLYGEYIFRQEKKNTPLIFLSTGVDNVFNDRAFTIGGGVRWRDDDLKYLLGSVPIPK